MPLASAWSLSSPDALTASAMCRQASTARTRLAVVWARLDGRLKRSLPSSLALTRHSGEKLRTSPRVACRVASASIPQPRSFPSKVSRHRCRSALRAFNRALGINNAGQVVGYADSYPVLGRQPALWDGASLTGLAPYGYAFAINDKGQIAADTVVATVYNGGVPSYLFEGRSAATAINESGQVAGYAYNVPNAPSRAVRWDAEVMTDLGTLGGTTSGVRSINNNGTAVGYHVDGAGFDHAALWNGNSAIGLTGLGGLRSGAKSINDKGQIVGSSLTPSNDALHATLWQGSIPSDLGTLGANASFAEHINNAGQIVGEYGDGKTLQLRAAIWIGGVGRDLNDSLRPETVAAGWVLATATSINENGWIVGNAYNRFEGGPERMQAYRLSISDEPDQTLHVPTIPEPSTYVMMLAGLGLLICRLAPTAWLRRAAACGVNSGAICSAFAVCGVAVATRLWFDEGSVSQRKCASVGPWFKPRSRSQKFLLKTSAWVDGAFFLIGRSVSRSEMSAYKCLDPFPS